MKNKNGISESFFEPCHIEQTASPFLVHERKSLIHTERFIKVMPEIEKNGVADTEKQ